MTEKEKVTVLVVEDDSWASLWLKRLLERLHCEVVVAETIAAGHAALAARRFDILFSDYSLPDGEGPSLIRAALAHDRVRAAYCVTGNAFCANVVAAMRAGAIDVMEKPFKPERLEQIIEVHGHAGREPIHEWCDRMKIPVVGEDPQSLRLLQLIRRVADSPSTVLITGESGTGKELVAHALHLGSRRRDKPMIAINCAAIPEALIEAELFGHVRGAFTGADRAREGKIAAANGGVLFLDEVGELPPLAQAKLLRVLQEAAVTPVGSNTATNVDVRIVAATNQDLEHLVETGRFRDDLYYRLNVVHLEPAPLRERKRDILPLARYFLERANRTHGDRATGLPPETEATLLSYDWPGNVRELANTIERAVAMGDDGPVTTAALQLKPRRPRATGRMPIVAAANDQAPPPPPAPPVAMAELGDTLNLRSALDDVERRLIERALQRTEGNRTEAAALLGLNRTTLVEKIRKFGT